MIPMDTFTTTQVHRYEDAARAAGVPNRPSGIFASRSAGAIFAEADDDVQKAVKALAKQEQRRADLIAEGIALHASGVSLAGKEWADHTTARIDAHGKHLAAAEAALDAVENARPVVLTVAADLRADAQARMLDALAAFRAAADDDARGATIAAVANDSNPQSRVIRGVGNRKPFGGKLIEQLERAVSDLGRSEGHTLYSDQHAKYMRGEWSVDVFGNDVAPDIPRRLIRRSYTPVRREAALPKVEGI